MRRFPADPAQYFGPAIRIPFLEQFYAFVKQVTFFLGTTSRPAFTEVYTPSRNAYSGQYQDEAGQCPETAEEHY
jgi:hypothetical protein